MPILLSGGPLIQLDGTMVLELAIFAALFFVLRAMVFQPLIALFEAREAAIDGARDEAKRMEREAKDKAAKFDGEMQKIRAAAQEERERMRQEGLKRERAILEQVRQETQASLADAERRLGTLAQDVRKEMLHETPAIANAIVTKLMEGSAAR